MIFLTSPKPCWQFLWWRSMWRSCFQVSRTSKQDPPIFRHHRNCQQGLDDIFNITQALLAIPVVAVNVAILFGGAAYLAWLSWKILASVAILILLGGVGYRLMVQRAFRWLNYARAEEDRLFGYFKALTYGSKWLKLHRNRRSAFYRNVQDTTETYQEHNVAAEN